MLGCRVSRQKDPQDELVLRIFLYTNDRWLDDDFLSYNLSATVISDFGQMDMVLRDTHSGRLSVKIDHSENH